VQTTAHGNSNSKVARLKGRVTCEHVLLKLLTEILSRTPRKHTPVSPVGFFYLFHDVSAAQAVARAVFQIV
jgi:hypothetical protein